MDFRHLAPALILVSLSVWGCRKDIQSKEAVHQGVMQHLTGRSDLDVSSMDVEVSSVVFRENEADATVGFRAKGSNDPASTMSLKYTLERKGNQWVVKGKAGAAGTPHGAGGDLPPGHPPMGAEPKPQQ
jgi:hypothetical protein